MPFKQSSKQNNHDQKECRCAPVGRMQGYLRLLVRESRRFINIKTIYQLPLHGSIIIVMMIVLLLFFQKQNLASAVYLFGLGTRLSGPGLKHMR
jgi:hypothetical protein